MPDSAPPLPLPVLVILVLIGLPLPLFAAESKEVQFAGHGGFELGGTLLLPDEMSEGGAPALLLLPGSGPTDRDGNQPPMLVTDLLASVAEHLAAQGVATLRFDKRAAHVHLEHILELEVDEQNEFLSWDSFVGDAAAGLAFLRRAEGVDSTRVGILGHSEGGLIALQVAKDLGGGQGGVGALVLAATPSETLADVLREQVARQISSLPEELQKKFLAELDRAIAAVLETGTVPEDLAPGLRALFPPNATKLLEVELALEPTVLAVEYPGPVLVLQGESDVQVKAASAGKLADALRSRETGRCEVLLVPSASHNFKHVESESDFGFQGPVVPAALEGLSAWLGREL